MYFKSINEDPVTKEVTLVDQIGTVITIKPKNDYITVESKNEWVKITQDKEHNILSLSFPYGPFFKIGHPIGFTKSKHTVTKILPVKCPIEREGCIYKQMYKIQVDQCQLIKWSV